VIHWLDGIRVATFGVHQGMAREKLIASPSAKQEVSTTMTYVITQPCIGTKDASCVDVCPVDCIHPTQNEEAFETAEILYIDPDECIDCGACEPACPVTAIFEESAVPPEWQQYIKINADFFKNNG
jgi:NAD-dependent dihydropyrimidine dehydrogenase PreA subunit